MVEVVTNKLRSVHACADGKISNIHLYVIYAMRNNYPLGKGLKIMIPSLAECIRIKEPLTKKQAYQFLCFCVKAEDWNTLFNALILSGIYYLELLIAMLNL